VRQVCSHAGGIDDIVEIKLVDEGADFAEQREGLANAAGGSKDDCFHLEACLLSRCLCDRWFEEAERNREIQSR
jgi:hypothetical protein